MWVLQIVALAAHRSVPDGDDDDGYDDGGHEDDDIAGGHASDILVAVLFTCVVDNVES